VKSSASRSSGLLPSATTPRQYWEILLNDTGFEYPLIADPKSEIIRSYGVLNTEATGFTKGMARPGYFYVTPNGTVKEKFF
jgi:alkyl hydroperoxide reductase subunit AhpC